MSTKAVSQPYNYDEIEQFIEQPERTYKEIISKLEQKTALKMQNKRQQNVKNDDADNNYFAALTLASNSDENLR